MPTAESDGVFEAVHNGPSPIQTKLESERASFYEQSEDCLYLNVWTAAGYEGQKRAVMAFIHGGAYGWGGTADPLYDGHNFVAAHPEIVLITVACRTGLVGFMDFSAVPGGEAYAKRGNLGILDQICALRYIRDNIGAFGGSCILCWITASMATTPPSHPTSPNPPSSPPRPRESVWRSSFCGSFCAAEHPVRRPLGPVPRKGQRECGSSRH